MTDTKNTVVGFAFQQDPLSPFLQHVILIEKRRPKWQAGRLNGIGGKIKQGETPRAAMVREFEEETSVPTGALEWHRVAVMRIHDRTGAHRNVFVFRAIIPYLAEVRSMTDEQVKIVPTNVIELMRERMLSNVPWLIGLCRDWDERRGVLDIPYKEML